MFHLHSLLKMKMEKSSFMKLQVKNKNFLRRIKISKKFKIIKLIVATVVISLGMSIFVYADKSNTIKLEQNRQKNEEQSIQSYQNLLSYIDGQKKKDLNVLCLDTKKAVVNLSDSYAGAYIDESGDLIVNVIDDSTEIYTEIIDASRDSSVKYRKVKNSLETLNSAYTELCCYLGKAPYYRVLLSETNNTIIVYTESEEQCKEFVKEAFEDVSIITIIAETNGIKDCASVYAGAGLTCVATGGVGTVGFCCQRTLIDGTTTKGIV